MLFIDDVILLLVNIGLNKKNVENSLLYSIVLLWIILGGRIDCGPCDGISG